MGGAEAIQDLAVWFCTAGVSNCDSVDNNCFDPVIICSIKSKLRSP